MSVEKKVTVKAISTKTGHAKAKETATVRQGAIEAEATESATAKAMATASSGSVVGGMDDGSVSKPYDVKQFNSKQLNMNEPIVFFV